jgi:hypothetical protein
VICHKSAVITLQKAPKQNRDDILVYLSADCNGAIYQDNCVFFTSHSSLPDPPDAMCFVLSEKHSPIRQQDDIQSCPQCGEFGHIRPELVIKLFPVFELGFYSHLLTDLHNYQQRLQCLLPVPLIAFVQWMGTCDVGPLVKDVLDWLEPPSPPLIGMESMWLVVRQNSTWHRGRVRNAANFV